MSSITLYAIQKVGSGPHDNPPAELHVLFNVALPNGIVFPANVLVNSTWAALKAEIETTQGLNCNGLQFYANGLPHSDTDDFLAMAMPCPSSSTALTPLVEDFTTPAGIRYLKRRYTLSDRLVCELR
jgi:hypothetical protein